MWLDKPEQWDALAARLYKAGTEDIGFGLDTETYGQPDKTSPQHRARVHCWSIGVLTDTVSPRGFRRAVGRVLPRAALEHGAIRAVLADPAVKKWAHNAPHDRHAGENEGVPIRGLVDSLQFLRVACPGMGDYGLKGAERWALGYGPRPNWTEMMTYEREVQTTLKKTCCECGASPCRKRSTSPGHRRVPVVKTKMVEARLEVPQFVPGAALPPLFWPAGSTVPQDRLAEWWAYSLADAVRGIELVDWLLTKLENNKRTLVYPWHLRDAASLGRLRAG